MNAAYTILAIHSLLASIIQYLLRCPSKGYGHKSPINGKPWKKTLGPNTRDALIHMATFRDHAWPGPFNPIHAVLMWNQWRSALYWLP
jgi:hypothetical protein